MKELRFYEYGGFVDSFGSESDSLESCGLSSNEIAYLRTLSESIVPGKRVFDITANRIKANSLVGVISLNGTLIEILPKLLRNKSETIQETTSILQNLMFMLSYTHALDVSDAGIGHLSQQCDSFIEAYISIFSNRLSKHLIRFGTPKSYVEKSENLNTVRGKIAFSKHTTINSFNQAKVFCEFSEFTENNSVAKAFKFVSHSLMRLTRNSNNFSSLNRCLGLLDGVEPTYVSPGQLTRSTVGKRDQNFIALVNLTKMFLAKLQPDLHGQKNNKVFSLIFDMNELFEEFIFQVLKRHSRELDIEVQAQRKKRLVSAERNLLEDGEWNTRSLFDTFTDIHIKPKSGSEFILDTKYKIISDTKSHYGISNQDAYQVLAYRQIHHSGEIAPSVALLYPKSDFHLRKEFQVNGSDATFIAATVDLSCDLRLNLSSLVNDLSAIIKAGSISNQTAKVGTK